MAEVALSDYLAYVFHEISRARDMADRYSKELALSYAKDDVLRHFAVPRFKLARMDLNMPVLVSGVQVSSLMKFRMTPQEFKHFVLGVLTNLVSAALKITGTRRDTVRTEGVEPMLDAFHEQLTHHPDPGRPDDVAKRHWNEVVEHCLRINDLGNDVIRKLAADLINRALNELLARIKASTFTSKATLEGLLINPETNVVKNGGSDASVFTMKAELMEEGLFVKSVTDETGTESRVVEFE